MQITPCFIKAPGLITSHLYSVSFVIYSFTAESFNWKCRSGTSTPSDTVWLLCFKSTDLRLCLGNLWIILYWWMIWKINRAGRRPASFQFLHVCCKCFRWKLCEKVFSVSLMIEIMRIIVIIAYVLWDGISSTRNLLLSQVIIALLCESVPYNILFAQLAWCTGYYVVSVTWAAIAECRLHWQL